MSERTHICGGCGSREDVGYLVDATIAALQARVQELEEITKVICGHCCEPMEIPSKAVLQSALTQRTAERDTARRRVDELEAREVDVVMLRDDLEQRTAELEAAKASQAIDLKNNNEYREQNRVLRGLVVHVEQIEADLHAALNGTRHDPSWIRPIQLSRNERQELYLGCIKDLQALKAVLTATSQPEPCTNHFSDGSKIFPSRDCCKPATSQEG